jgi:hypothetical protein
MPAESLMRSPSVLGRAKGSGSSTSIPIEMSVVPRVGTNHWVSMGRKSYAAVLPRRRPSASPSFSAELGRVVVSTAQNLNSCRGTRNETHKGLRANRRGVDKE